MKFSWFFKLFPKSSHPLNNFSTLTSDFLKEFYANSFSVISNYPFLSYLLRNSFLNQSRVICHHVFCSSFIVDTHLEMKVVEKLFPWQWRLYSSCNHWDYYLFILWISTLSELNVFREWFESFLLNFFFRKRWNWNERVKLWSFYRQMRWFW